MAGGPLTPTSAEPGTADRCFPNVHLGAGAGSKRDGGLGWQASLGADGKWELRFALPNPLPSGTLRLRAEALSGAQTGAAKLNPHWVCVAAGGNPSAASLFAEGTQTLTWAAGDNDDYKSLAVVLDATTVTAGQILVMDLWGEAASWTLAQVLTLANVRLVWED